MNIFGMKIPLPLLVVVGIGAFLWYKNRSATQTIPGTSIPMVTGSDQPMNPATEMTYPYGVRIPGNPENL